jgi:hypothetical protein
MKWHLKIDIAADGDCKSMQLIEKVTARRYRLGQAILDSQEPRCRVARLEELELETTLSHTPDQKWDVCKFKLLNMGCKWQCANMKDIWAYSVMIG